MSFGSLGIRWCSDRQMARQTTFKRATGIITTQSESACFRACLWEDREAARNIRKGADKYHDLVTEMLETAIRRVGNEYADMLFEYDQQRREAEKQCEQLAMEGMMKK